jgi:thiamine biosynthesis lipoprotein ApbE
METDALSTAFFVMGPEKVRRYCEVHPGLQVILVPEAEEDALCPLRIGNGREVGEKGP